MINYFFWKKENDANVSTFDKSVYCSIIICAHNEENNIKLCLESILNQKDVEKYAEIILVDDASKDNTKLIAKDILNQQKISFQIISNEKKLGKKRSIENALKISNPQSEWIILRDADTYTLSKQWLHEMLNKTNSNTDLIIAPVIVKPYQENTIQYLQYYENLALMHLTLGSLNMNLPILCNAANMAFKKSTFQQLKPYKDNYHIQSGDDTFLLLKMKSAKRKIVAIFNEKSIIYTYPISNINKILKQKRRWLSKNSFIKDTFNTSSMLIIGLTNFIFIPLIFYSITLFSILFAVKFVTDYLILYSTSKKLNISPFKSIYFFIGELLYIPYVCALIFLHFFNKKK